VDEQVQTATIEKGIYKILSHKFNSIGAHTIKVEATDNAGKITVKEETVFVIDRNNPPGGVMSFAGGPKLITANVYPRSGMKGVSTDSDIYLPFNEVINDDSISKDNIQIKAKKSGALVKYTYQTPETDDQLKKEEKNGQFTIKLIPDNQLKFGVEYEVVVKNLIDVEHPSEMMEGEVRFSFKVNSSGNMEKEDVNGHIRDIGGMSSEQGKFVYVLKSETDAENADIYYLKGYVDEGGEKLAAAGEQTRLSEHPSTNWRTPRYTRMAVASERRQALVLERKVYYAPWLGHDTFQGRVHIYDLSNAYQPIKGGNCKLPENTAGYSIAINGHYAYIGLMSTSESSGLGVMDLDQASWGMGDCNLIEVQVGQGTRPVQSIGFVGSEVYVGTNSQILHLSESGGQSGQRSKAGIGLDNSWIIYSMAGVKDYRYTDSNGKEQVKDVLFIAATDWSNGIKVVAVDVSLIDPSSVEGEGERDFSFLGKWNIDGARAWPQDDMIVVDAEAHLAIISGMTKMYYLDISNPEEIEKIKDEKDRGGRLALNGDGTVYSAVYYSSLLYGVEKSGRG
jgi:hypothetical protein